MTKKRQKYSGIVYSTNETFEYQSDEDAGQVGTLPNSRQDLRVMLDKKMRGGKVVTLVKGFTGTPADLSALGKQLKQKCGVGGSVKDEMILIQGDFRQRILQILIDAGYRVKISGG
ncbi:translation initiation factor [Parapedobacter tibetensis]|uniref:translation initiation factor n=1 Tax=Parapedobacter tibetensis TaxID=2972951 RepID=UPI00214DA068|nr:translation initiation factor [Parapedobacter tibetensis]